MINVPWCAATSDDLNGAQVLVHGDGTLDTMTIEDAGAVTDLHHRIFDDAAT